MDVKKVIVLAAKSELAIRLEQAFIKEHFEVTVLDRPEELLHLMQMIKPNASIIDWDIITPQTRDLIRKIREKWQKTALILVSRTKNERDRIIAIEEGADDCIINPNAIDEVIAKVKALIRRIEMVEQAPRILNVKDIVINLDTHEVRVNNHLVDLTYTQFRILHLLGTHRDYVFTRNEILNTVWGENVFVTDRTVDVHVKRLREKLGGNKQSSRYIQTIHGLGYRFA